MSAGLDRETLEMIMEAFRDFAEENLPEDLLLDLDHKDEFPHALVNKDLSRSIVFVGFNDDNFSSNEEKEIFNSLRVPLMAL